MESTKQAALRSGLPTTGASRRGGKGRIVAVLVVMVVVIGSLAWWLSAKGAENDQHSISGGTAVVHRGDLVITVTEGGNLRAKESTEIVNKVEGSSTIIELVPEGTHVQPGDVLMKLDAADLQEKLISEDASLQTQKASYLAAEEALAIQVSVRESELKTAELNERFAKMDFEKYRDGDWPQQQKTAKSDITVAEQELKQAENRLKYTKDLEKDGIVTREELESDELSVTKAKLDFEKAELSLKLLEKYDYPKQMEKLKSDWDEAIAERERVQRRQDSEVAQKTADRNAKKANYEIQNNRVNKLREQIASTVITAPQAGMIVYWTPNNRWSDQRPPEVGGTVRHRQTLMTLPDVSKMEIDVKIHESQIDRVAAGQSATVKVDAFPDRKYTGTVTPEIGVMADSQRWFNPDVKVYNVVVAIDQTTEGLKPGMSAQVEIVCDVIRDKLLVPVTGVHVLRGQTAAIVKTGSGLEVRRVKVGPTNDKEVVIEDGLEDGDVVMLYEPDVMPKIPWEEPKKAAQDMPPAVNDGEGALPGMAPRTGDGESPQGNQNAEQRKPAEGARPAGDRGERRQGQGRRNSGSRTGGGGS
ncbi:MAG: HlyD family efflux transporter periplasmic adaptor subunit [Planctomycetes bacterium]|nr:HlyD family efflux transporter periplasmic adaptor subunit [Planctomycetota bacterium]